MVKDDRSDRDIYRQFGHLLQLGMIKPRSKTFDHARQLLPHQYFLIGNKLAVGATLPTALTGHWKCVRPETDHRRCHVQLRISHPSPRKINITEHHIANVVNCLPLALIAATANGSVLMNEVLPDHLWKH